MTRQATVLALLSGSLVWTIAAAAQSPGSGTVTLPLSEYDRLLDRAAHPPVPIEAPPVAATVASATIQARVDKGVVRGTIALGGEVFQTGAVEVPLLLGASLTEAERAGKPLALRHDAARYMAVLQGPAPFEVKLGFVAPVAQEPGRASCQLPVALARSTRLVLEIPRGHAEVLLEGGLVTRRVAEDNRTRLEATLLAGRPARVSWTVRDASTAAAPREARFVSDVSTLATIGEIDLRLAVMLDVSVVAGAPGRFDLELPEGFELTSRSGVSLDGSSLADGVLTLVVNDPSRRRHQFLLALERTTDGGLLEAEIPLLSLRGAQRETGEVAIEGLGTMELSAKEGGTLRRMDGREAGPTLRALGRHSLLAAFRYHRRPSEEPRLTIQAQRFPDAPVLAALADSAVVTTLVTAEGRSLSEISLNVRNQAQPYLRVALPDGATLVSAAIEGEAVKPVEGADGTRVPLLRPGFRPTGPYTVSFVYMGAGSAFGKKGEARLSLARMDLPIAALYWEMFVPDRYKVKKLGGDAWPHSGPWAQPAGRYPAGGRGISGTVTDSTGAAVASARVTITNEATGVSHTMDTTAAGRYAFSGLPPGSYRLLVEFAGFKDAVTSRIALRPDSGRNVDVTLEPGDVKETIEVLAGEAPYTPPAGLPQGFTPPWARDGKGKSDVSATRGPSQNVVDLQRRVAGVLPVRIDVPRAGTSLRFVRPLVLDEETTVTFQYKRR